MGIQISEDKLSPLASKALKNAKNKSQFLRDAIEFYVQRGTIDDEIRNDLNELKEMIRKLHTQPISNQSTSVDIDIDVDVVDDSRDNKKPDIQKDSKVKVPACYDD